MGADILPARHRRPSDRQMHTLAFCVADNALSAIGIPIKAINLALNAHFGQKGRYLILTDHL
jgi:hypothetical protein